MKPKYPIIILFSLDNVYTPKKAQILFKTLVGESVSNTGEARLL